MAKIINNVALSAGEIESLDVLSPMNVRFQIKTINIVNESEEIVVMPKVKDGSGFVPIDDGNGYAIQWKIKGNKEFSRNLLYINSALLKVFVYNAEGLVGNITIDTYAL